jgi:hypothetical protein
MPYAMHRVFCAAAGDLEPERQAFYDVMAELNEAEAMPRDILFVAVSIPMETFDTRPFQAAISENIRACRYFIQVLEDSWGPPEKNFERDYALASQCAADPEMKMEGVAVFFKKPLVPHQVDPRVVEFKQHLAAGNGPPPQDFADLKEYKLKLRAQLSEWLGTVIG